MIAYNTSSAVLYAELKPVLPPVRKKRRCCSFASEKALISPIRLKVIRALAPASNWDKEDPAMLKIYEISKLGQALERSIAPLHIETVRDVGTAIELHEWRYGRKIL